MLKICSLHAYYGAIEALKGLDLNIQGEKITCIIGSNGAGKTTLLKSISGVVRRTGSIKFEGREIINNSPRKNAILGITHVPEGRHVFPGLTVEENLETGTISWHGFFGNKPYKEDMEEVYTLFPRLKERRKQYAWSLSGGEQQMLAIGRAIMARPKLLMLDEPSMGLAPLVVEELFEKIIQINKNGIPILLVEQNARMALDVAHYAYIIDSGRIVLNGDAKDLVNDPRVIRAYFGSLSREENNKIDD